MEKKITSVLWSASNVPAGLSFNTASGTFSGTPTTEGDYTVPVTVKTNYGQDTKNVKISVAEAALSYEELRVSRMDFDNTFNAAKTYYNVNAQYDDKGICTSHIFYMNNLIAYADNDIEATKNVFYFEDKYGNDLDVKPNNKLNDIGDIMSYVSPVTFTTGGEATVAQWAYLTSNFKEACIPYVNNTAMNSYGEIPKLRSNKEWGYTQFIYPAKNATKTFICVYSQEPNTYVTNKRGIIATDVTNLAIYNTLRQSL